MYSEVAATWVFSVLAFVVSIVYLRGGRLSTVSERYQVIARARDSLLIYTLYWVGAIALYVWAIAYVGEEGTQFHDVNKAAVGFAFVFSARGLVTFSVRGLSSEPHAPMRAAFRLESSCGEAGFR